MKMTMRNGTMLTLQNPISVKQRLIQTLKELLTVMQLNTKSFQSQRKEKEPY